ncbi:helix-turn-helix transcriptional regulator [Rhodocytophaga rosea]|uniref:Helix-turn-helix transcriptional regulator n=1 Tax=Rhodocytophaga rosea TaxID=2704465 RepID=A0A6C0GHL1_9BACT|nr:helix-turn-helix transcriptional regulator [Rhodocytophaga rosea]QHT67193.1 helix-turn-helix transcriptional regulator [Rhodocytophaga rosea]
MIRKEFPDLHWLKKQIEQQFVSKQGWPNCIINARGQSSYRPDIKGTLSLFMNVKGETRCGVDNQKVQVDTSHFFISNQHQPYTLEVENTTTETFNIHFSEKLLSEVYAGLITPADILIDNHSRIEGQYLHFFNRLYRKEEVFTKLIQRLYLYSQQEYRNPILLDELLTDLLVYLMQLHRDIIREMHRISALKKSTQVEIYKRLCESLNYLHSFYNKEITLDELSAVACLSKFHYLRLFKSVLHLSPHQYLLKLRLDKAKELLQYTQIPVTDISITVGFENNTSFSRLFQQRFGQSPLNYRLASGKKKLAILVN